MNLMKTICAIDDSEIRATHLHLESLYFMTANVKLRLSAGGQKILRSEQNFGSTPTRIFFYALFCSITISEILKLFLQGDGSGRRVSDYTYSGF